MVKTERIAYYHCVSGPVAVRKVTVLGEVVHRGRYDAENTFCVRVRDVDTAEVFDVAHEFLSSRPTDRF